MAGEGGFLSRWSKRKRGDLVEDEALAPAQPVPASLPASDAPQVDLGLPAVPDVGEPDFDLASLPTLEEVTGSSDMSAFLQRGVPQALQNAALRKAWVLDPFIKDHIGPVECGWDFNDPMSMTGFGPLDANVDASAMLKQIMGEPKPSEEIPEDLAAGEAIEPETLPAPPTAMDMPEEEAGKVDPLALEASGDTRLPDGQEIGDSLPQQHAASHNGHIEKIDEILMSVGRRRHGGAVPN